MTQHQTIVPDTDTDTDTDTELRMERDFNASIDVLFEAWTNQKALRQWMGPQGMTCPEATCDAKLSGEYRFPMKSENDGLHTVVGTFTEFAPPHSLSFTWSWIQEDGNPGHKMAVFVKFKALEKGKTRMTLLQTNFRDVEAKNNHETGWIGTLTCLDDYLK